MNNEKINILMLGSDLSVRGGMTTVVESFLNSDLNKSFNIIYIPTHIDRGLVVKTKFFMKAFFKSLYVLLFNDIQIIHMHLSERGSFFRKYLIFVIGKMLKKEIVIHMHGAEFKEFYNNSSKIIKVAIKSLLKNSSKVLVLGSSWNEFIKSIDKSIKTLILRNSVIYTREKVKFNEKDINILFLAVLEKRKGVFDLIKAANMLLNNKNLAKYNIKFLIAGSGKEEASMKEMIKKLNLEKSFEFSGWVDNNEKKLLLKKSQLFVLPSYNEGLPVAILEAMSYGIPIISTDVGSIKDAVENNKNGYVIKPGNFVELKNSIKKCIESYEKWSYFSRNNKVKIKNYYNERDYFITITKLYYDLLNRG